MPCKDPDHMEMPCQCDCGEWFDLQNGFPKRNSNVVICKKCHEKEKAIYDQIEALENEIEIRELHGKGTQRMRARLEKLQTSIE